MVLHKNNSYSLNMFKCDVCNKYFAKEVQLKAHFHPTSCSCKPFDAKTCQYCVENVGHVRRIVPWDGRCGFGPGVDCLVEHFEIVKVVKNQAPQ